MLTTILIIVVIAVALAGIRQLIAAGFRHKRDDVRPREISLRDPTLWFVLALLVLLVVLRGSRAMDGDALAMIKLGLLATILVFFAIQYANRNRH